MGLFKKEKPEEKMKIASVLKLCDREQLKSFVEDTLKGAIEDAVNHFSQGKLEWWEGTAFENLAKSGRQDALRDAIHNLAKTKVEDALKKLIELEKWNDEEIINIIRIYASKCVIEILERTATI